MGNWTGSSIGRRVSRIKGKFKTIASTSGAFLPWRIDLKIRQAAAADTPTIAQFNSNLAWETEERKLDAERVLAGVSALLNDPSRGTYFIAEIVEGGKPAIAGQLLITHEWSDWRNGDFWWIQSVYVEERFRGRGVFRALYQHVHDLAREQKNVCGIRLYMDTHNDAARRAYERLGMKGTDYQVFEADFVL
jgi:GNAT superfamily N-acetyltransferase